MDYTRFITKHNLVELYLDVVDIYGNAEETPILHFTFFSYFSEATREDFEEFKRQLKHLSSIEKDYYDDVTGD